MHIMLNLERVDVFEGINVDKTRASKECNVCHYWYSLDKGLQFQSSVSNSFHDVLMMLIQIISIAVLNINDVDFCLNY